jgi:hypothetical protein
VLAQASSGRLLLTILTEILFQNVSARSDGNHTAQ